MIRKRGKFFEYEFMEGGKRFSGTFNGKKEKFTSSEKEARDFESVIRVAVRNGTYGKEKGLDTFAGFFDSVYMKYANDNTADWKHAESRGQVLKDFFAGKTFREIKPLAIIGFANDRLKSITKRGTTRSPVTVSKEVALASAVFRMAISEGVATENPCASLGLAMKRRLPARNKRDRVLSCEEEPKLFAQLVGRRDHLNSIVRFALDTGLRKSELCRLEVQHVNLTQECRFFTIDGKRVELQPNGLLVAKSKSGKPRIVPLTADARRIAEIRIADTTTRKYIFGSSRTGGMTSEFKTAFVGAVRDAGLEDFRFHDLRHTFATRLNETGADPFVIRDLLGHSTVTMSSDYTQTSSETRQRAIGKLNDAPRRVTEKFRKLG
jgi:integrase